MKIGDEIEVSSDEEGFKGSWFRAILEDPLPKYGTKKLNVSLLANDGSSTTPKTTYRRFLRPIPPESLFTAAVEFEEGCVVEASRVGGWWSGVVVKKINDEEVWVYFDSPPDLFQFQTVQLRQHFDWVKQEWVKPKNKVFVSKKKSKFSCGTMVEVKVSDAVDVWVPSVIVKELGNRKSFVVKSLKNLSWNDVGGEAPKPNITVDSSSIRLTPPAVSVERRYGLMESVEVFVDPGWRPGTLKGVLCENSYTVFIKGTNQSLVLKHDAIRPSKETIAKLVQNTSEVNAAATPQTPLSLGENGENDVPDEHSKCLMNTAGKRKREEVEHTPDLSETADTESVSSLNATALEQTESGTEEITLGWQDSSEEVNNNQVMGIVVLPFAKESSIWKELETKEVFQRAPQTPHFSPLVGIKEVFREGCAIGMMFTFSKLLESFKDLEPDVPMSQLDSFRESLAMLQRHGFDVSAPLARINKLVALKDRQLNEMVERKGLEGEMMALRHKIVELERQQVALKTAYQNLESCARARGIVLDNLESEFKATSSAPWEED